MDPKFRLLFFLIDLVLPLALGYCLAHYARLKKGFFDGMMLVSIVGLGTPLALLSCWRVEPNWALIWLPLLGVLMQVVPGAIGLWRVKGRFDSPLDSGSYILSAMLSNRGTAGSLAVVILAGEQGYAYCRLVMLLAPVVVYCFCFPMAGYFHARSLGDDPRRPSLTSLIFNVRQVPVLGVIVGLSLALGGVPRPEYLGTAFKYGFHPAIWVFTIPVGASLNFTNMRRYLRHVVDLVPLKFIVTPLVISLVAWAVGLEGTPLMAVVILSASPTALNAVITSRLYKLNVDMAMASLLITTTIFVAVAVPALLIYMT